MREIFSRFDKYMIHKGLNDNQVTVQCSLAVGLLSQARKGKSDLGRKTIDRILTEYQDLNRTWLLTGEGSMLNTEVPAASAAGSIALPLIPITAMAGALTGTDISITAKDCDMYVVPIFHGAQFLIRVQGDSMVPAYHSGDIVACKSIPLSNLWFQWGKTYVLDTRQGALIKRIEPSERSGYISIHSENPHYKPFDLAIEEINGIAIILGVIRAE